MIRVYRITQDGDRYQSFTEREYERYALGSWDCRSRRESWVPPEVEVIDPPILDGLDQGDLAGDFWQGSQDTLVTSPRATEILRPFLEAAGELLPLPFEGVEYTVLNVTRCVDCFDDERAEWRRTEDGRRISLKRYAFLPDWLPTDTGLFKVPEMAFVDLLVVEGLRPPEEEFRAVVARHGLRGLK